MAEIYKIFNGAMPTTAAQLAVATGTAIKTMMQLHLGDNQAMRGKVLDWGISFEGEAAATPIVCELLTTGTVPATSGTAYAAADIMPRDPGSTVNADNFPFAYGTGESCFAPSAEGSIVAVRQMDVQFVAPTNQYVFQFPLGREPMFLPTEFLRIRTTSAATENCYCFVTVEV